MRVSESSSENSAATRGDEDAGSVDARWWAPPMTQWRLPFACEVEGSRPPRWRGCGQGVELRWRARPMTRLIAACFTDGPGALAGVQTESGGDRLHL